MRLDVSAGLVGGVAVFELPGADVEGGGRVRTIAAATPARLADLPAGLSLLGRPRARGGGGDQAARDPPGTHWLALLPAGRGRCRDRNDGGVGAELSHADAAARAAEGSPARLVVRGATAGRDGRAVAAFGGAALTPGHRRSNGPSAG